MRPPSVGQPAASPVGEIEPGRGYGRAAGRPCWKLYTPDVNDPERRANGMQTREEGDESVQAVAFEVAVDVPGRRPAGTRALIELSDLGDKALGG